MNSCTCPNCQGTMYLCTDNAYLCEDCDYVIADIGSRHQDVKLQPDLFEGFEGVQLGIVFTAPP